MPKGCFGSARSGTQVPPPVGQASERRPLRAIEVMKPKRPKAEQQRKQRERDRQRGLCVEAFHRRSRRVGTRGRPDLQGVGTSVKPTHRPQITIPTHITSEKIPDSRAGQGVRAALSQRAIERSTKV